MDDPTILNQIVEKIRKVSDPDGLSFSAAELEVLRQPERFRHSRRRQVHRTAFRPAGTDLHAARGFARRG